MVRKVVEKVPSEQLRKDLEKYRRKCIELGATDAKVIDSDMIVVDERVRAKCLYPKCHRYGTNANCPPYVMELGDVRELVKKYQNGILINIQVPAEQIAGSDAYRLESHVPSSAKMQEIVSKIEAEAFSDGYYLALGFAAGSCKTVFCPDIECQALKLGQACRNPLRSRPSMESMGMDAFAMATKMGWDVYPIGRHTAPSSVPYGHRLGLVLVY
jgi:predicted metal-binding protein